MREPTFIRGRVWNVVNAQELAASEDMPSLEEFPFSPLVSFVPAYKAELLTSGRTFSTQFWELNASSLEALLQTPLELCCTDFVGVTQSSNVGLIVKPWDTSVKLLTYGTIRYVVFKASKVWVILLINRK